jgi:hypothetical protein
MAVFGTLPILTVAVLSLAAMGAGRFNQAE